MIDPTAIDQIPSGPVFKVRFIDVCSWIIIAADTKACLCYSGQWSSFIALLVYIPAFLLWARLLLLLTAVVSALFTVATLLFTVHSAVTVKSAAVGSTNDRTQRHGRMRCRYKICLGCTSGIRAPIHRRKGIKRR